MELEHLTECFESDTAEFIVIYGRRRLGKSELVRESIESRGDAIYKEYRRKPTALAVG
ncbi:AAA+ superfamily ATPase fused to HTH and RecB nuclease domains (plasmid) [Natrarchaeobaculum sulfurireducens]|uniref:AAA+ superfamily ATPase fused to HTH and RecB nuclease domains n=1 Tax=Natrarchaeobaculum sulfurireducens TaxID=2044521 RepID=A0A346PK46_9EURY|nr:AAA+ superfamily ATPase fused to HTH and RecB nuclease domains [Natrarchaeobaculum sulfurireducens]